ncbi:MAG: carboxypeptidase-like regulatory domain-containing protein [Pseudomonadota bacterium]
MTTKTSMLRRLTTVAIASCASASVLASGPLNLNPNDPIGIERWPNGGANIPWNPDGVPVGGAGALALGPLTWTEAVDQTATAFAQWAGIASATATYSNNGPMPFDVDETNFAPFVDNLFNGNNNSDGFSPIVYDDDGAIFVALFGVSGVLGFASTDTRDADGTPIEAVAFLNGGSILDGFPISDFFSVQVHEFGHYSGMGHTVVNGQNIALGDASGPTPNNTFGNSPVDQTETMYPFAIQGGLQSSIHADDVGFYSVMYPTETYFAETGTISGEVVDANGTGLTGINVIARNINNPFIDAVSAISGDREGGGVYEINGLTPGESYVVFIDNIQDGGFSTTPIAIPGPEEFWNEGESDNVSSPDDPTVFTPIIVAAGDPVTGIDIIINRPGPGVVDLGDDDSVEIPLPFTFQFCGIPMESVFINSNGSLTFLAGDTDFSESVAEHLTGPPRIAGLWDDLSPNQGGEVSFSETDSKFRVEWNAVSEFLAPTTNTFAIELLANGKFNIEIGDIAAIDGLTGYSCSGLIANGTEEESDLNTLRQRIRTNFKPAVYEIFSFGEEPNDLANTPLKFQKPRIPGDPFEPNDTVADSVYQKLPYSSADRLTSLDLFAPDVDFYSFHLEAGQTLLAEVTYSLADTVIGLFLIDEETHTGTLVATDDDGGAGTLSAFVLPITESGKYALAVSSFPDFGFTGAGASGGRYIVEIDAIDGILLSLGDDDSFEIDLGFAFPFNGESYTSVFVNSNGNLTFGSGDTDFSESTFELLADQPRIAPLWDDLSPNQGGQVIAEFDEGAFTVTFEDVPEFFATTGNTFSVTLSADGSISISYGDVAATDGIAGVSAGGGIADPGETDLSATGGGAASGATYEQFGFGDENDLDNSDISFSD